MRPSVPNSPKPAPISVTVTLVGSTSTTPAARRAVPIEAAVRSSSVRTYDDLVFRILALLFLVVPIVEIYIIIQVGAAVGGWNAIALMVLVSMIGAWMVRREGLSLIGRIQSQIDAGSLPTKELVDGLLVVMAGALMLTPGFLTDAFGLFCLFPPTRILIRTVLIARFANKVRVAGNGFGAFGTGGPGGVTNAGFHGGFGGVVDVGEATIRPDDEDDSIELGPPD